MTNWKYSRKQQLSGSKHKQLMKTIQLYNGHVFKCRCMEVLFYVVYYFTIDKYYYLLILIEHTFSHVGNFGDQFANLFCKLIRLLILD